MLKNFPSASVYRRHALKHGNFKFPFVKIWVGKYAMKNNMKFFVLMLKKLDKIVIHLCNQIYSDRAMLTIVNLTLHALQKTPKYCTPDIIRIACPQKKITTHLQWPSIVVCWGDKVSTFFSYGFAKKIRILYLVAQTMGSGSIWMIRFWNMKQN